MADNRKGFTCIWKIESFSFSYLVKDFESPYFFARTMGETEYKLHLRIDSGLFNNLVACYVSRSSNDTGQDQLELDYEISFLSGDGTLLKSETFIKTVIKKNSYNLIATLITAKTDIFFLKRDQFISNDTFTIRCRLWKRDKSISQVERCLVKTRIEMNCKIFIGTVEKFSCIKSGAKYSVNIGTSSLDISSFSMNLFVATNSLLNLQIKCEVSPYICKIFILDKYENKVKAGQSDSTFSDNQLLSIPLPFSRDYLMKNKEYFLPNDELTIHCEIILPGQKIDEIEYIFDSKDIQAARKLDVPSEEHIENVTTLTEDLVKMFREGDLFDAKLKTATETFLVHKVVLSARSPIFKSMFTNDMQEKTNHCVEIDDLDADTVRLMLLFMYSDTLDDLDYETAKSLYFAGDKYNIVSLRQKCSNFLKQNLLQSNCLEILLLADKHQDKDLKHAVQNYIAKNDDAVLFSDGWRNLEKSHSELTTEVFRFIYMKNRRN